MRKVRFLISACLAITVGFIAADLAFDSFDLSAGVFAFYVLTLLLVAVLVEPVKMLGYLSSREEIGLFGLTVRSAKAAEVASVYVVRDTEFDDDEVSTDPRPSTGDPEADLKAVVDELKTRLRFVRQKILADPDFLDEQMMVLRLVDLGVLPPVEAELAQILMRDLTMSEIDGWPQSDRENTLDAGWKLAMRFRSRVFDRFVRRELESRGFLVADFEQRRRHRRDFVIMRDGKMARATARTNWNQDRALKRFKMLSEGVDDECDTATKIEPRLILLPDHLDTEGEANVREKASATVLTLKAFLDESERFLSAPRGVEDRTSE